MSRAIPKDYRQSCGSRTDCRTGHEDRHTGHLQTQPLKPHQEMRERKGPSEGEVLFIPSSECYHTVQAKKKDYSPRDETRHQTVTQGGEGEDPW